MKYTLKNKKKNPMQELEISLVGMLCRRARAHTEQLAQEYVELSLSLSILIRITTGVLIYV